MIPYQAQMLPEVDYQKIEKNFPFSLVYLEHRTMQDYCDFLESLQSALIEEHLIQVPELLVAHLCAFLGTAATVHTVHQAEKLESSIIDLIKRQAHAAYKHFNQHPINSTIKSKSQKKQNVAMLRKSAPGSIIVQTMRLGRVVMDMLEELKDHRQSHFKSFNPPKQTDLFCSQETLIKIMLLVSSKKCAEWREQLEGLSDNYVINQLAIQIGWLIGYFSHLDNLSPDETQYFDYGLPLIHLYRDHVYQLMKSYASAVHAQEAAQQQKDNSEAEALLNEIQSLSAKTHAEATPATTKWQKQTMIFQADLEKLLIELLLENMAIKILVMSTFYFWFVLDAPLRGIDTALLDQYSPFDAMGNIIHLIKTTTKSLPEPTFSPSLKKLNKKMQLIKSYLPHPASNDQVDPKLVPSQTTRVNTAIHTLTSKYLQDGYHPEIIANVLFNEWLRLSVFYGISENEWQKMDHYFVEILTAVRGYLPKIFYGIECEPDNDCRSISL